MSAAPAEQSTSLFSSVMSFFVPAAHCEAAEEKEEDAEESGGAEEEEEEEPEDPAPAIREECEKSPACQPAAKHFQHCAHKIEEGKGWHGEDCVEELFHMMHCVDACAAPKIFKKLV